MSETNRNVESLESALTAAQAKLRRLAGIVAELPYDYHDDLDPDLTCLLCGEFGTNTYVTARGSGKTVSLGVHHHCRQRARAALEGSER